AYVNRENISNGASALVDSSREGYKAISDKVASFRKTETTKEVETKEEAFDLLAAQKKLAKLEGAESRLTGRINKATKDGNDKARESALTSRTEVRAQIKALAAKISEQAV
ncbi:MAG: hypothetical protein L7U87_06715, partial [Chlamydiales bacterium]|nr:hypothetical protein [Chlamydiales bacterium]